MIIILKLTITPNIYYEESNHQPAGWVGERKGVASVSTCQRSGNVEYLQNLIVVAASAGAWDLILHKLCSY